MTDASASPLISVVIPVYCEEVGLEQMVCSIERVLIPLGYLYEIIIVDDGSKDSTWLVIEGLCTRIKNVQGIRFSRNFGKEAAISAGLETARGEGVIIMDGDLQHPPDILPEMIQIWKSSKMNIVEAIKEYRGRESLASRLGAAWFYFLFRRFTGMNLQGATDFKLMDRTVVEAWRRMPERNVFFRGMSAWIGFDRAQIRFHVPERANGHSRWTLTHLIRLALSAITAFSSAPLHLITLSGLVFGIIAFILGVQTLFAKISGTAVAGFTTINLLLLVIGSMLMVALGIIGEYLARIYDEVKMRPRYIISKKIANSDNVD